MCCPRGCSWIRRSRWGFLFFFLSSLFFLPSFLPSFLCLIHIPPPLYTQVMKQELTDECSYTREAQYLRLFGSPEFLGNDPRFKVPWVWEEGSTDKVLIMERVGGVSVGAVSQGQDGGLSQRDRDDVRLFSFLFCFRLCLCLFPRLFLCYRRRDENVYS